MKNQSSLLDEKAAARRLCLSHRTLQRWRCRHRGPRFVRLGKAVRYRVGDLNEFVRKGMIQFKEESGQTA